MSIKTKLTCVIFVSLLPLLACAGSSNSSSETTVSIPVSTTVVATTTTTIDPTEAAADHYLEIVKPVNCAQELFNLFANQFDATSDDRWKNEFNYDETAYFVAYKSEVLDNARIFSDSLVKFASDLGVYDWPSEVQGLIDPFIAQTLEEGSAYSEFSKFNSFDQLDNWEWPTVDDENYAGVIRAKLGLPSNINNDMGECKEILG